eukprot:TRINITY_DN66746_c0_g1_i1.p1 TRINITY_DN66746_c0_g1~~TRINITY_DN66746_c0_g1_i1.p1  ORF type:complete len:157 (-),score=21.08 TRINITY_DN66746_c0_g1_i1:131-601(-)
MSSGATVSDECVSLFNALKLSKKYRYLLFTFNTALTEIVPSTSCPRASGNRSGSQLDLNADECKKGYEEFVKELPEKDCRYGVFDLEFDTPEGKRNKICFFTWAPDTAPIKTKMVFASSKDIIKKRLVGIGTEIQATDLSEVDYDIVLDKVTRSTN